MMIFAYHSGSEYVIVCSDFVQPLEWTFILVHRCVICQMEYRRGNLQMTLPCKHVYHASCVTRWLSINKVSKQNNLHILGLLFICPCASFAWGKYITFTGLPSLLRWSPWRGTQETMSYRLCGLHEVVTLQSWTHCPRWWTHDFRLKPACRPLFRIVY